MKALAKGINDYRAAKAWHGSVRVAVTTTATGLISCHCGWYGDNCRKGKNRKKDHEVSGAMSWTGSTTVWIHSNLLSMRRVKERQPCSPVSYPWREWGRLIEML